MLRLESILFHCLWLLAASRIISAQHVGDWAPEVHPALTIWTCTASEGCQPQNKTVVLEGAYHYLHVKGSPKNCMTYQGTLNEDYCYDDELCAQNCVIDGANYTNYGVSTIDDGASLKLDLYLNNKETHPRLYLLDEDTETYTNVNLVGKEFTFDVDMSRTSCDISATVYFVQMPVDGGKNRYNDAGAYYGTGYCDAQCYVKPFVNGTANYKGYGLCCTEIDIWEANIGVTHIGALPCKKEGVSTCSGTGCGNYMTTGGECCHGGCGIDTTDAFFGVGKTVDTTKAMTVVTQFHSKFSKSKAGVAGSSEDVLLSMQQLFVQNGKIIKNMGSKAILIDDAACPDSGQLKLGGFKNIGRILKDGLALTFSIFYAKGWKGNGDDSKCSRYNVKNASVVFSNVRWGDIGSTYNADGTPILLPSLASSL